MILHLSHRLPLQHQLDTATLHVLQAGRGRQAGRQWGQRGQAEGWARQGQAGGGARQGQADSWARQGQADGRVRQVIAAS